jgi:hypothetical protein
MILARYLAVIHVLHNSVMFTGQSDMAAFDLMMLVGVGAERWCMFTM